MKFALIFSLVCTVLGYGLEQRKTLTLAGKTLKMLVRGSSEDSKVSLDEVALKGEVFEDESNEVKVNIEASYDFGAQTSLAKVIASVKGNCVTVKRTGSGYDLDLEPQSVQGQSVSASYSNGAWDYKLGLGLPSAAMDKLKDAIGGRKVEISPEVSIMGKSGSVDVTVDALKAQVTYALDGALGYKASYSTSTPVGVLKASLLPKSKSIAVEIVDSELEDGASWTANFEVPIDTNPKSLTAEDLNLKVKRTIKW